MEPGMASSRIAIPIAIRVPIQKIAKLHTKSEFPLTWLGDARLHVAPYRRLLFCGGYGGFDDTLLQVNGGRALAFLDATFPWLVLFHVGSGGASAFLDATIRWLVPARLIRLLVPVITVSLT